MSRGPIYRRLWPISSAKSGSPQSTSRQITQVADRLAELHVPQAPHIPVNISSHFVFCRALRSSAVCPCYLLLQSLGCSDDSLALCTVGPPCRPKPLTSASLSATSSETATSVGHLRHLPPSITSIGLLPQPLPPEHLLPPNTSSVGRAPLHHIAPRPPPPHRPEFGIGKPRHPSFGQAA